MERVSVAEVKKNFSEFLSAAAYGNKGYIITRRGKAVAALIGVKEFEALQARENNSRSNGLAALVGKWDGGEDLSVRVDKIYRGRERNIGRDINMGE
jgi:prevent-host-death family protein